MAALFHKTFAKKYARLPRRLQIQTDARIALFLKSPDYPQLHVHALKGDRSKQWSFNVTGDYRVVYEYLPDDTVRFLTIGTHSELFG